MASGSELSSGPSGGATLQELCDFEGREYASELLHTANVWTFDVLAPTTRVILKFTTILEDIMFRYQEILIWDMKTSRQQSRFPCKLNVRQIQRDFRIMGTLRYLYYRVILINLRRVNVALERKNQSAAQLHCQIGQLRTGLEQARNWIDILGGPSGIFSRCENSCRETVCRKTDLPRSFPVDPACTDLGSYLDEVDKFVVGCSGLCERRGYSTAVAVLTAWDLDWQSYVNDLNEVLSVRYDLNERAKYASPPHVFMIKYFVLTHSQQSHKRKRVIIL